MSAEIEDDVLIRAIAAHRKVNPTAYSGLGLRRVEEEAMRAALVAARSAFARPVPYQGDPGDEQAGA